METEHGTQEVDFKTLTAEEAFEVLGVCLLPGGAMAACLQCSCRCQRTR